MALEPLIKHQAKFYWTELVTTLSHYNILLLDRHEPIVRKYLQGLGYTINGNQETLPVWQAEKPQQRTDQLPELRKDDADVMMELEKVFGG